MRWMGMVKKEDLRLRVGGFVICKKKLIILHNYFLFMFCFIRFVIKYSWTHFKI